MFSDELAEAIDAEALVEEASKSPLAWSQRLGFLLELVEAGAVVEGLASYVQKHATRVAPLEPSLPRTGCRRSKPWRIAVNVEVEVDK